MPTPPIVALENSAANRAIDAVIKGQPVLDSFVDFTTALVQNVIQTVIQSTMDQLEAYADLVAAVSGTLADYEVKMFPDLDAEALTFVNQGIKASFGADSWTDDVDALQVDKVQLDPDTIEEFKGAFYGLVVKFIKEGDVEPGEHLIGDIIYPVNDDEFEVVPKDLIHFAKAKLKKDIKLSYDKLVTVLKLGMQKVLVTQGKIESAMSLHVTSKDTSSQRFKASQTNYSAASSHKYFGMSGSISGKILGISFGGSHSAGATSSSNSWSLGATVLNQNTTAATTLDIDISGRVELCFKTETFPSTDPLVEVL